MRWADWRVRLSAARLAGRQRTGSAPPPAIAAPPEQPPAGRERLRDVAHPIGLTALVLAPIVLLVLPVAALLSGGAALLGRGLAGLVQGIARILARTRAGIARVIAALGRLIAPVFAFAPPPTVRERPGDGRFHPEQQAHPLGVLAPEPPSAEAVALVRRAMAEMPDKGDDRLPDDLNLLAALLGDAPPAPDFRAADMVRDCFESLGPSGSRSRALLAVATNLARHFARPTHMPLATARAWRMLDPVLFEDEMAAQLAIIGRFIADWQKTQQTFLCLEFGEIEMIESLFEALNPTHHAKEMADVLNFKVLSNRRQGLLRRIPHRVRKTVQDMGPGPAARDFVTATQAFLNDIATARNYQPIIDAATAALDDLTKYAEKQFPAALPPPGAAGQPLARIAPVKMPASELADRALREAAPPRPQAPQQPPRPQPAARTEPAPEERPRLPGRRSIAPGPRFSAESRPFHPKAAIGIAARHETLPTVSTHAAPLPRGARPSLPAIAMGPLPVLASSLPAAAPPVEAKPRPATPLTGRISLPAPGARPVVTATAPPPPVAAATAAAAAPKPPPAKGVVTPLVVVPKIKRPPITQAVKRQSVLKVLRGESSAAIAASLGIRETKLDEWVDAFIAAGSGALSPGKPKPAAKARARKAVEDEPLSAEMLRAKLAEVLATAQLIERAMDAQLQPRRPVLLPPPDTNGGHNASKRPRKKG